MENLKSFEGFLNPRKWGKIPPIPETGEARQKWLAKYDPKPEYGDARIEWLDKYDPDWRERANREMDEYMENKREVVANANLEFGKFLEGSPFRITNVTEDDDDQGVTDYEIESDKSRNENEIFFTLEEYVYRDYTLLLVKRTRKKFEIGEEDNTYEIERQIRMPDMETGLRWIKRNWRKALDTKNTDTVKDVDPNRNPGWFHDYKEIYKRREPIKSVEINSPDTSTFDNYKFKYNR